MQKAVLLLLLLVMVGCVDTGRAGFDPQLKPPPILMRILTRCSPASTLLPSASLFLWIRTSAAWWDTMLYPFNKVTVPLSPGSK